MTVNLRQEVEQLVRARALVLPTWPGVAMKLQKLVSSGNYGISELAKLVEADQALAANTLRTANSAYYRATSPVTTLPQAISRIGASELSNIAIAGTLGLQAATVGPLASLRKESWRKSLVGAALAQVLSRGRGVDPGEGFLAGLLCDFGETIAWAAFETVLARHPGIAARTAEAWHEDGDGLRVELGMVLAEAWKLPPFITEVVMRAGDGDVTGCQFPNIVTLVATTSEVTRRVLAAPSADAAQLDDLASLRPDEREMIARVLPGVPGLLQAYDDAAPAPKVVMPSLVASPTDTTLPLPVFMVELSAAIRHKDREDAYQLVAISHGGARLEGKTPQPERHLVTLDLDGHRYSAMVKRCQAADGKATIELQPFAMDKPAQAKWAALVRGAQVDLTV